MSAWVGSARLRAAVLGEAFLMQAAGTSTGSRSLRQNLAPLFRSSLKGRGPDFRSYAVYIWIEGLGPNGPDRRRQYRQSLSRRADRSALAG